MLILLPCIQFQTLSHESGLVKKHTYCTLCNSNPIFNFSKVYTWFINDQGSYLKFCCFFLNHLLFGYSRLSTEQVNVYNATYSAFIHTETPGNITGGKIQCYTNLQCKSLFCTHWICLAHKLSSRANSNL